MTQLIRVIVGPTTVLMSIPFTNTGTVHVESGHIRFDSGGFNRGTFNIAEGATVQFESSLDYIFENTTQVIGEGLVRVHGDVILKSSDKSFNPKL